MKMVNARLILREELYKAYQRIQYSVEVIKPDDYRVD